MEVIGEAMSTISTSDAVTSSSTAATGQWFNLYDRRFRLAPRGPREPVVQLVTGGYDDLGSRCRVLREDHPTEEYGDEKDVPSGRYA